MSERKSKRRSSLAASRIQLKHEKTEISSSGDLHKMISVTKTDEERLAALHRLCLEYTLQKLQDENPGLEGLQDLNKELRDQGLRKIAELEENGSFKQACVNDRIIAENPNNLEMDEIIDALVTYNKRLVAESEKWEKLLKDSSKTVADIEETKPDKLPPVTMKEVMTKPEWVSLYLPEPLDNSIYSQLQETVTNVNSTVSKFRRTVSVVQLIQALCEKILKERTNQLKVDSFRDNPMFTPRTIIQKITGLQTPKT
uniref:Uncharacterized protein LOC111126551 n=1 Tax=Crassostrea virginica TaxID=6565 RepID=A0A8B8DHC9_CRAVI|nr:uncharacterized protein LOC111126551 [Crassostrea virginica]